MYDEFDCENCGSSDLDLHMTYDCMVCLECGHQNWLEDV